MKIKVLEFVEGAQNANGVTVIIDVFRAFTVGCYAFDSGAVRIIATAGTKGLINAVNADIVITGSFVNTRAVVNFIKAVNPENVSLVAMGYRGRISAEEDILCAETIESSTYDKDCYFEERISALKNTSGKRFFDRDNIEFSPPTDFFLCTMVNKFDFILKAETRFDGNIDLMKIDI